MTLWAQDDGMQSLVVAEPRKLAWREAATPGLVSERAALVRPVATATCDFDHLIVAGAFPAPLPLAIGHECVAEVLQVGAEVTRVRVGDKVVVPFQISCGDCPPCLRGHTSACASVPWLSCYGLGAMAGNWGGAFADVLAVPFADAMLLPLPADIPAHAAAALSCNVVDGYRAVAPIVQRPGEAVLIVSGAFSNIALYAVVLARVLGAGRVDFFDRDRAVCERAARLGATIVDSSERIRSMHYPVTVEASMDAELMTKAVEATLPAGHCTVTTMFPNPVVRFPLMQAFERCLTLVTGQPHVRGNLERVLQLMAGNQLRLGAVTDAVVSWDDAPDVLRRGKGKFVCCR